MLKRNLWPPPYTVERCPACWWPFHLPREQPERYLCLACQSKHKREDDTVPTYYAPCIGGPYDGRRMVHHEVWDRVTYERHRSMRTIPGYQGPPTEHLAVGGYAFHPTTKCWHWFSDIASAPAAPETYAMWITKAPVTA